MPTADRRTASCRRVHLSVLLLVIAFAVTAHAAAAPGRASPARGGDVELSRTDCSETFLDVQVPRGQVEGDVPRRFVVAEPVPGQADVWQVMSSCRTTRGMSTLLLTGVAITPPGGAAHTTPVLDLNLSLLWALTDDRALASRLRRAQMPVTHVPGLRFQRCLTPSCRVHQLEVPWSDGYFRVRATKEPGQAVVPAHQHDTVWWYERPGQQPGWTHLGHSWSRERLEESYLQVQQGSRVGRVFGGDTAGSIGVQHGVDTEIATGPTS